jgi:alpha-2-macroglobulin
MTARRSWFMVVLVLCISCFFASAQQQARIQEFSPQGTVQKIRQVRVRFSEAMVAFGDPHAAASPFAINCTEKAAARWADSTNWIYDFDQDLPPGIRCEFNVREDLKSLNGNAITGQRRFEFSTGGPAILNTSPYRGSESISDDQIFILELSGSAVESSVLAHVSFAIHGISEKVGIRVITGQQRDEILKARYPARYYEKRPGNLLLIQAKQRFPAKAQVNLIWGIGVSSPTGVATTQDQVIPFKTQVPFAANFHCQRENAQSQCVPVSAMRVSFTSSVPWKTAKSVLLKGPEGKVWKPRAQYEEDEEEGAKETGERFVNGVTFNPPFPESSAFTIEIPAGIEDDAGHKLTNAGSFPLRVRTDEYPPLAKFAAEFGILELKSDPMLPVTLRNLEPELSGKIFQDEGGEDGFDPVTPEPGAQRIIGDLKGKILKIPPDKANQMFAWINKVAQQSWDDRDKSIFGPVTTPKAKAFKLPRPQGGKPFEVIGIPLKEPGFYVVEIESEMLGASLLETSKPMFVPTTVLVTNLSIHFKWGAESSLVWVTTLDKAEPVRQAKVEIRDCEGKLHAQGLTDANGIVRIASLSQANDLPNCSANDYAQGGLIATAQLNNDMTFVHSGWNQGIENWRYNLPTEWHPNPLAAHTILDRSLFRAGETVHMKHLLRRKVLAGFDFNPAEQLPKTVVIQHLGSEQKYEFPLKWDSAGIAENAWSIPKEAKLGTYQISLKQDKKREDDSAESEDTPWWLQNVSGSFRVEEYRVPLTRAIIRPPSEPLINPASVPVDLTVSYLSGGGASGLPVKFRYDVRPRYVTSVEGFENFLFSNGSVKEGITRGDFEEREDRETTLKSSDLNLDKTGSARTTITGLAPADTPMQIFTELEFRDANGEVQTASSSIPLWPASRMIGIQPDSWLQSKGSLKFKVAVLDLKHKPVANAPVSVILLQRKSYSHRKRLVGGFYAYENYTEIKRVSPVCDGKTDARGLLLCTSTQPVSGNLILQASTKDEAGHPAVANRDMWVAGDSEWWFAAKDDDRIDLLPERKRYEPGQKARFQVRMPFRKATALISIEREGVGETFIKELSGKEPVIEIPVKGSYSPNVFVSVLVVRGRMNDTKPTATVDLGRPAYKLGISEINVGWSAHELKVKVSSDREQYTIREKAKVQIAVTTPEGAPPPKGAEVALAAVDEGLLELMPNTSWQLLDSMMGRRSYNVQTSTAQMHVIGKRHFGLKALPQGGGGGSQATRELFDTLLLWKGRVPLNEKGQASVEVPLNDSITSFRIVAVATAGPDRFGTGSATIRSNRDLILLSGIAPIVRQGDTFRSTFTLRNTTARKLSVRVTTAVTGIKEPLTPQAMDIGSGESKELFWDITAPAGVETLRYQIEAVADGGVSDRLSVTQKVVPPVPVRAFQSTLTQLTGDYRLDIERPKDALPGMGGVDVSLKPKLVDGLTGVSDYMRIYPYSCLEQLVSKSVAMHDVTLWKRIAAELPAFFDSDGLLKYFPSMYQGSDVLTSYVLAVSQEAGYEIPDGIKLKMTAGLRGFAEGKIVRYSSMPTVDLSVRKLSAIAALSRAGQANGDLLSSITIEPNLWPTSALIDWLEILKRGQSIRNRDARLREAQQILRARLNFQGTIMTFSTERTDCLWWLMISPDENAVRILLNVVDLNDWKQDIPRLVRGALGRQKRGHWDTTVANAWGVLAMDKFSRSFEGTPVTGSSTISLAGVAQTLIWSESTQGKNFSFTWPTQKSELALHMTGTGQPWATVKSLAAIPLMQPVSTGFKIKKTFTPIEQKDRGAWTRGDLLRVRLEMEAQSDMTWVVVDDPIPAGATILGSGMGRDSQLLTRGEKREGWVWPVFEERSFEAFRSYFEFVPKGSWVIEYTVRLNNEGTMHMPPTRVEAMYSPEMFGELPNQPVQIK